MIPIGFGPRFTLHEDFVVWLCPECGQTFCWPVATHVRPSTTCYCSWPESVTQMLIVWPPQGKGVHNEK